MAAKVAEPAATTRNYIEAVRWFAAACILTETGKRRWEEVDKADLRQWVVRLLGKYSTAYAGHQFRAPCAGCAGSLSRRTARTLSKGSVQLR